MVANLDPPLEENDRSIFDLLSNGLRLVAPPQTHESHICPGMGSRTEEDLNPFHPYAGLVLV